MDFFTNTSMLEVLNLIFGIGYNSVGLDEFTLKFTKRSSCCVAFHNVYFQYGIYHIGEALPVLWSYTGIFFSEAIRTSNDHICMRMMLNYIQAICIRKYVAIY
jgi:hypothetical protein